MNKNRTSIYLPVEVEEAMKQLAEQHTRSLNGEINQACKAWIQAERDKAVAAFDAKVAEVNELAKQLPNGRAWRLHQDHEPLNGLVVQWRGEDGIEHYHDLESPFAISEARGIIRRALSSSKK